MITMQFCIPFLQQAGSTRQLTELEIGEIVMPRFRLRREITDRELTELSKSIAGCGVLQPPLVRKVGGSFELVCGVRRVRAAELAGLRSIPCVVAELDDRQAALASLTENLRRRELSCFEQAEAYREILSRFGMTQSSLAMTLGVSQAAIANKLRLLGLQPEVRDRLCEEGLSERHARALLTAEPNERIELLERAAAERLTAEGLEKLIAEKKEERKLKRSYQKRASVLSDVRLFVNTIERAVKVMRLSGVNAETERRDSDGYIEYVIRIPEKSAEHRDGSGQAF
ncbi:MAG: ParB/RepB/Spo0J family partition protein [Ruminococcus sp.]|nr:ParB/RepB/Spo0J family partition protein [Ruminococcus sp.]